MGYTTPTPINFSTRHKDKRNISETAGGQTIYKYFKPHHAFTRRTEIFIRRYCIVLAILFMTLFGLFISNLKSRFGEIDATQNFSYPYFANNFQEIVTKFRSGDKDAPSPMNMMYAEIPFFKDSLASKESQQLHGLLIVIKSAVDNFEKRHSIRTSWGNTSYLRDTQLSPELPTKLAFICGVPSSNVGLESELSSRLLQEEAVHKDLIIADFLDNYSNNTYKSILALRWVVENFGENFQYLFLVDDDVYIDLSNLRDYIVSLPKRKFMKIFHNDDGKSFPSYRFTTIYGKDDELELVTGQEILGGGLYMGKICKSPRPSRPSYFSGKLGLKWAVSVSEYPFDLYPPYGMGMGIVLSHEAVYKMLFASYFVKHYWIDDVYLGILAYKMGIIPVNNPRFLADYEPEDEDLDLDEVVIALHGAKSPWEMHRLWTTRQLVPIDN